MHQAPSVIGVESCASGMSIRTAFEQKSLPVPRVVPGGFGCFGAFRQNGWFTMDKGLHLPVVSFKEVAIVPQLRW